MFDEASIIADRYRIEGELGRGGMGRVYLARHLLLDEQVALKVMHGRPGDPRLRARALREARASARLRSDFTVRVLDVLELKAAAEDAPHLCLVLEYVEGPTLAHHRADHHPLPVDTVVRWVMQIAVGLAEAHAAGIVHRDLKTSNVLLATRPDGQKRPKIIDFGIAKSLSAVDTLQTADGVLLGSPAYMAPEQIARASAVDGRADIWSLGVVAFELLTGALPFEAFTTAGLLARIERDPPRPPLGLRPDLDPGLADVVLRCLAKEPEERFADVAALGRALAPHLAEGPQLAAEIAETLGRPPRTPHALAEATRAAASPNAGAGVGPTTVGESTTTTGYSRSKPEDPADSLDVSPQRASEDPSLTPEKAASGGVSRKLAAPLVFGATAAIAIAVLAFGRAAPPPAGATQLAASGGATAPGPSASPVASSSTTSGGASSADAAASAAASVSPTPPAASPSATPRTTSATAIVKRVVETAGKGDPRDVPPGGPPPPTATPAPQPTQGDVFDKLGPRK